MKLATMKAQANRASALTMPMATMLTPFVGDKILAVFILFSFLSVMRPFAVGSKRHSRLTVNQREFLTRLISAPPRHRNDQRMKAVRNSPTMPTMAMVPLAEVVAINCEYELLAFICGPVSSETLPCYTREILTGIDRADQSGFPIPSAGPWHDPASITASRLRPVTHRRIISATSPFCPPITQMPSAAKS
jgi:hypothetical protein